MGNSQMAVGTKLFRTRFGQGYFFSGASDRRPYLAPAVLVMETGLLVHEQNEASSPKRLGAAKCWFLFLDAPEKNNPDQLERNFDNYSKNLYRNIRQQE